MAAHLGTCFSLPWKTLEEFWASLVGVGGNKDMQGEAKLSGFRVRDILLHAWQVLPFLCGALPTHGQILICSSYMNSIGSTLTIPWVPARVQKSVGLQPVGASLGIPWDFCWVASALPLVLSWIFVNLVNLTYNYLVTNSLRTCTPSEALSVAETNGQLAGGSRSRGALGFLLICLSPSTGGISPQYAAWPLPSTSRPHTGSYQLWITL